MAAVYSFESELLEDGHLAISGELVSKLKLRTGSKLKVSIEIERPGGRYDRAKFLTFFGVWAKREEKDLEVFREIYRERARFGREGR